jgi:hypothetical protein
MWYMQVLEQVGEKMAPVIREFLMKSASLVTYAGKQFIKEIEYTQDSQPYHLCWCRVHKVHRVHTRQSALAFVLVHSIHRVHTRQPASPLYLYTVRRVHRVQYTKGSQPHHLQYCMTVSLGTYAGVQFIEITQCTDKTACLIPYASIKFIEYIEYSTPRQPACHLC